MSASADIASKRREKNRTAEKKKPKAKDLKLTREQTLKPNLNL